MMNTIRNFAGHHLFTLVLLGLGVVIFGFAQQTFAAPIACRSGASVVKAVTDPDYHAVTTIFPLDTPSLQQLMITTVHVSGVGFSCIIAHFSALARITDNYIVFQVRVDRQPMEGHLTGLPGLPPEPVVFVSLDEISQFQDEQLSDPTKIVSYNFFKSVGPGVHTIQVMVAAGSNIDPANPPLVGSPVLTLEYR
jgi:hypothetical protein